MTRVEHTASMTGFFSSMDCPVSGSVKETVNVTVPVNTDASGQTVYLAGNLSALGGTWNNVEKNAGCGDIGNRGMSVNGGTVNDAVANWGGPAACGDSTAVVNVTVPAGTPSGDTVYLSGNYDVLGTGIPAADDWIANDYPMTKTGTNTWTLTITGVPVAAFRYKFTLGSWSNVEETSGCGYVSNRDFGFNTANASYTASDTVAAWQGVGGC